MATEAANLEILTAKLKVIIPELLIANEVFASNYTGRIELQLVTRRKESIEVA